MRTFYINQKTGDIEFDGQNKLKMVENEDEGIVQGIWMILTTNLGEWFLNDSFGFAKFMVLGQKYDEVAAIDELNAAILQHDKIATVENVILDFDRPNRKLSITYSCTKTNGQLIEGVAIA